MAVIQISFLSLFTLPSLNPTFAALSKVWFVNGFNIFPFDKATLLISNVPTQMKGISMFSLFIQNYNFTFLLLFVPSLIFYILAKTLFKNYNQL